MHPQAVLAFQDFVASWLCIAGCLLLVAVVALLGFRTTVFLVLLWQVGRAGWGARRGGGPGGGRGPGAGTGPGGWGARRRDVLVIHFTRVSGRLCAVQCDAHRTHMRAGT